jgi:ABC-type transporter Mla subunit MlaD
MNSDAFREISARNDTARDIVSKVAGAASDIRGVWQYLDTALADVPALLAAVDRLTAEIRATRCDRANLLAAIRACLAAAAEGEDDPLGYLRAEPGVPAYPATDTRRRA